MKRHRHHPHSKRPGALIQSISYCGTLALLLAGAVPGRAQAPAFTANGVVNGVAPNVTGLVAGDVASIFGTNLDTNATSSTFQGGFPPTVLGGTSVTVGGFAAHLYFASQTQVNFQIPWELSGQASAQITVTTANGASAPVSINLAPFAPALFSLNGSGSGAGTVFNSNGTLNCNTPVGQACAAPNPAFPGSVVAIAAANLGPSVRQQFDGTPPIGNVDLLANTVTVTIGGVSAPVVRAELCGPVQNCPAPDSTYLVFAQVPNVTGAALPVVVTEGAASSNAVTMNVAAQALTINNGAGFGDFQKGPVTIPLLASGGVGGTYTWALAGGALPPGLAVRNDGGPSFFQPGIVSGIEGVATTAGNYNFTLQVSDGTNTTTLACTMTIVSLSISAPNQFPDGLVGANYPAYTPPTANAGGAVTWALQPNNHLPGGLQLDTNSGAITGTPNAPGNYGFNLSATDSSGTTTRFFNIQVYAVGFSGSTDLGLFQQGQAVNVQLAGTGGTPPYKFTAGGLPPGLSISQSGQITGTITNGDGTFRFNVGISDNAGNSVNRNFAMGVIGFPTLPAIGIENPVEDATIGESRNYTLNVSGGQGPYNWTITGGTIPSGMQLLTSRIPANFNLGPNDAVIIGAPSALGTYTFTVNVTDSLHTVSVPMTINVKALGNLYPANPTRGVAFSYYVEPLGGTYPYVAPSWTILSGTLPAGLSLNGATGVISGTPTADANTNIFLQIAAGGITINRYIGFNVLAPTIPIITLNNEPSLPDGLLNSNYNFNLSACCAPNGLSFSVVGVLPAGLNLNANGNLSGTPTQTGSFTVTIKATDNNNANNFGIGVYSMNVAPFVLSTPTPLGNVNAPYSTTFSATGGTGPLTWQLNPGSQIPPGLSVFNNGSGVISGTPGSAGSFHLNYKVTDTAGHVFNSGTNINIYPNGAIPPPSFGFGNNFGTYTVGEINFALNAGAGNGTYTWSIVNGSLPTGVALRSDPPLPGFFNGAQAGLSGVATIPGVYNFTISVTSAGQTSYQYCTWKISQLDVMDGGNLPPAFVGVPYPTYTFTPLNAQGPVTWTLNNGTTPPPGLTFSGGALSGTPTTAGSFNTQYIMSDGIDPAFRGFNLNVYAVRFNNTPGQNGFLSNFILNNVPTGTAVNATFNAAGGSGGYTYTSAGMPCCLSLSSGGVLSGTLNGVGNFGFQVTVTDTSSNSYTQEFSIDAIGDPPQLPSINLGPLNNDPISFVGAYMSWLVSANNGGTAPFTWTVTGLPPGVSFRPSTQSELTYMTPGQIEIWGTATAAGTYNVTYKVTDANGLSASATSTMTISPIMVDFSNFPSNGTVGVAYSDKIRVLGGTGPYAISQQNPTFNPLPDGLTLNAAAFTISGTPLEDGNFSPPLKVSDSGGNSFVMLTGFHIASATSPQITINNGPFLGTFKLNAALNYQFSSCCLASNQYTYSLVGGSLPNGLNLSATGQLSGTPTTAGQFTFLVKSADSSNSANAGFRQFEMKVSPISLTASTTLPFGNVGALYNYAIPFSGNAGGVTFQLGAGSLLPQGVTMSVAGVLNGTPSAPGQFQFNATITDAGGNSFIGFFNLSIYPAGSGPAVQINTGGSLTTMSVGVVQIPLVAVGGTGSYSWTVIAGSLPPGLALRTDLPGFFPQSASAGIIGVATAASGTPYSFTLKVTSGTQSATQAFTLKITNLTAMENEGFRLPDAFAQVPYSYTLTALNNSGAVTFKNPVNLPPGVTLSPQGVLSGTPTTTGFYNMSFTLADSVDSISLSISVAVQLVQVTSPSILPNATQGSFYTFTPAATGGASPYTFNVGGFPNGLALNNGVLSGTVTGGPGRYFLNVTATDSNHVSYNKVVALDVLGIPATLPFINPYGNLDDCTFGAACSRALAAVGGGIAPFTWTITGLPNGMSSRTSSTVLGNGIAATDVELWGAPSQLGTFNVKAVVSDSSVPPLTATQTFSLTVSPLWPDTSFNLVNGTLGAPYSRTLRVLGGIPALASPLYGAVTSPFQMPEGLALNGLTVSGTPLENGGFSPQFLYTDSAGTANTLHFTWFFSVADSGTSTLNANTSSFADAGGSVDNVLGVFAAGTTLNFQLGACCAPSFNWTQTGGSLPPGISLSTSGLLSGTIAANAAVGPYTFQVTVAAGNNAANTADRQYTIFVSSFNVSGSFTLPYGVLNSAYSQQLQTAVQSPNPAVNATFSLRPGYYLPPGITLSASGLLSGTPTTTGQYQFVVIVTNNANSNDIFMAQFNLSVWTKFPPLFLGTGPTIGPLIQGQQSFQLTASGGVPPYHYSVTPGSNLPPNFRVQDGGQLPTFFQLSQGTGGLLGVVEGPGQSPYQTSLRVTDSAVPANVFDRPLTMIFTSITIPVSNNPPAAYVGSNYTYTYSPTGGTAPYLISITGLPAGITLTGATISGTPTVAGTYTLTVNVKDTAGTSVNFTYTLSVYPFNIPTGQILPQGTIGQPYSQQISAPGCTGCTWSIVSGGLPFGLSINSSTGVISGSPGGNANSIFVVQAKSNGASPNVAQKAFSLYVPFGTPQPLFITNNKNLFTSAIGNGTTVTLFAQGGTPPYTWAVTAGRLPAGMSLVTSPETVAFELAAGFTYLMGRPLELGPFAFTLTVTDSAQNHATGDFTWQITPSFINTTSLPANGNSTTYAGTPNPMAVATYGEAYSQQIEVIGGTGTYTSWTTPQASNPLPVGLSVNQTTGVVTGTPGETGFYSTLFQATDTAGNTLEQFVNFNIVASSPATVNIGTGPLLGPFQSGLNFTVSLNPSGGTGPYTFTVLDSLPPGCALESGSQLLSNVSGPNDLVCAPFIVGVYPFTLKATDSQGNFGVKAMVLTISPQTLFTTTALANGSAGTAYSQQLLTFDNGGNVTWAVSPSSALPPGMTLNGAILGGTPSTPGNYSFVLTSTDSGTGISVNYTFNLSVSTITITNPVVIPTHVPYLAPYSYQFNATGGGANKTWLASNLPPGISIDPTTGLVTGMTAGVGNFNVTVTVTDGASTLTRHFTIFVDFPQLLTVAPTTTALADARLQESYVSTLPVSGGIGPYTWSVAPGSNLPDGMNLYSGAALPPNFKPGITILAGIPTTAKQYTFTLIVTDSSVPANSVQATYTLNVSPITFAAGVLPNAIIGTAYSRQLTAVGGTGPYTFSFSESVLAPPILPQGIGISPSGLVSGTPTSSGSYSFKLTVTDNASHSFTNTYSLLVTNANGLNIPDAAPINWSAGRGIYGPVGTSGNSTYTWSIVAGALPPGLTINSSGIVSGVLTTPGSYNVTLRATDNNDPTNFVDRQFPLNVAPMQLNFAFSDPPAGTVESAYSYQLALTGGTAPYTFATTPLNPLPPGLALSASGLLSGIPTQGGSFTLTAMVTDHAGATGWVSFPRLNILNPGQTAPLLPFQIHSHIGVVGAPFALSSASGGYPLDQSFALGGSGAITYAPAAGSSLPPGMQILGGTNGVPPYLGGIPTSPGEYNYSLTASDSAGHTATVQLFTVVSPLGALPSVLPNGTVGTPYSATISAFGGTAPYTYGFGRTTDGSGNFAFSDMPPGLSLSAQGVLSGTPTIPGTFNIVAFAADSSNPTIGVLLNYTVVIDSAGTAPGIGIVPATPIQLNYVLTSPAPAAVPVNVTTTSGTPAFNAMVSGIPGASLSPSASGNAPAGLNLNLNTAGLAAGTYAGVVGISAPTAVNSGTGVPVVLTVTSPPPCVYTLIPTGDSIPSAGGSDSFTVSTGSLCSWTATTTDNFVSITPASAAGTGTGTVQYSVSANGGAAARTGTITVNGQHYAVTQFGSTCALALTPPSVTVTAAGGLATVNVTTTNSSCAWTASGLGASPTSGTGNGQVTFTIPSTNSINSQTLTATVQLNGGAASTFSATQTGASCTAGLSAPGAEIGYAGGAGQVNVTTPVGCAFSTVNGPSWISVTSPLNGAGSGPGPLTYSVAPNSTTVSRSGTLTIGGVPYTISQDPTPCSVTVDAGASGSPFNSTGGGGTLAITANGSNCTWTASSPVSWITLAAGSTAGSASVNGSGSMNVIVNAASNAGSTISRSTSLTVAGQSVAVTEAGTVCTYTLGSANSSIPHGGGSGSVSVTAPGACSWSATADATAPWLTIGSSGSGGTGNVDFSAAPNNTSAARSGTLTIAGQPFTVTEAAGPCSYILNATSATLSAAGGSGVFTFSTATTGCTTQAISFANWLTATTASSPDGTSGTVSYTATANPSGATRVGTVQFAGQTFAVSESGAACAFSLNSYGLALGQSGGAGNVFGSPSAQGCSPAFGTNQPTIVTLGALAGPVGGIFTLPFTVVSYNSSVTGIRTMVITFGGQFFTIKQTSW